MQLYQTKRLGLADLIRKFTVAPAELLRLAKGTLRAVADADVTVIDLEREWVFERERSTQQIHQQPVLRLAVEGARSHDDRGRKDRLE